MYTTNIRMYMRLCFLFIDTYTARIIRRGQYIHACVDTVYDVHKYTHCMHTTNIRMYMRLCFLFIDMYTARIIRCGQCIHACVDTVYVFFMLASVRSNVLEIPTSLYLSPCTAF
jgi:hypothetical protein